MKPIRYKLRLEPDLKAFTFKGTVQIQFESGPGEQQIFLNCLDLTLFSCEMKSGDQWKSCNFEIDSEKESLGIALPGQTAERVDIRILYTGVINDKMAGFYRSAYSVNDLHRHIAVTQFEESDARRAFPCMDHPLYKAVFEVELVTQKGLMVIANEAAAQVRDLQNGMQTVRFHPTPVMSTYLVFFGVGEFETLQDGKDPRIIGAALPGRIDQLEFGVTFGRKALHFCESYFNIPYPLTKMHLIAVPDFAFGAMENWGAITFRENLLLHQPGLTSRSGAQRICEVIAHEIAHQWFGNLVTPSDWKYLWLNESFATYFGYGVVDHYYPQWGTWDQFLLGQTQTAMVRDALMETFPIEIPGGEHVVINAGTAPIIYSKGGSLLRQIQGYIGSDHFQKGLQHYLKSHQYACASSHDLWNAFEAVSDRPVTRMVRGWIEQPGFPLVEARRDANRLTLSQQRFTYLPASSETLWPIPVALKTFLEDGKTEETTLLLEQRSRTIDLAPGTVAVKVNAGQTGFYRTHYPGANDLEALGKLAASKVLGPEDRWGLESDLYAMVRAAKAPFDAYLKFLDYYEQEDAYLPLSSMDDNLFAAALLLGEAWHSRIAEKGCALAGKTLKRIGTTPSSKEPQTVSLLREQLIWHAALYGHEAIIDFAKKQFSTLTGGSALHPDLSKCIMQTGALTEGDVAFNWLLDRLETSTSEHERMNALTALGCFSKKDLLQQAAQYALDSVPPRNKFIPLVSMATNPYATPFLWRWFLNHVDALETFHPMLYERVIGAVVPIAGMADPESVRSFFKDYLKKKKLAGGVIRLSLEKLEINLNLRQASSGH